MTTEQNPLATQPIGKLIATYAIPSIISMLVNSLYNIVDQIFIGHGVGYLGNAATTIAFPIITIGLAIALIFGNGCAAFISLKLGAKDSKDANAALGGVITMLIIVSIAFMGASLLFLDPLLHLLGATDNIMEYSRQYVSIILIGQPFVILSIAMSNVIRADGNPRYSMMCMVVGAVLNTILDPIFIFVFKMGVSGAAIATVLSQVVSFVIALAYFRKGHTKHVSLRRDSMSPHWHILKVVMALGLSSFVTQMAISFVNIILNNSLRHYGALSTFGSEIPLSAMGIVIKVSSIMIAILVGISIGAQPILGFNYGAKNYARVKETYQRSVIIATLVSIGCWVVFMLFPDQIIRGFGDNAPEFVEFGGLALRTFLGAMFIAGFQIISSNYFQATGHPAKATILSMSRQILFLIPLILLFGMLFGLIGVLFSGIVADVLAAIVTACFIIKEMKRLNRLIAAEPIPLAAKR